MPRPMTLRNDEAKPEEALTPGFPRCRYALIYADPPWLYDDARTHASAGMARSAYACVPLEELCRLPVADLADPAGCALALWATGPKLPQALHLMERWGFRYCTVLFTWVKRYPKGGVYSGLGHYSKSGPEFLLLGRRG